jgi:hypothetical protein
MILAIVFPVTADTNYQGTLVLPRLQMILIVKLLITLLSAYNATQDTT